MNEILKQDTFCVSWSVLKSNRKINIHMCRTKRTAKGAITTTTTTTTTKGTTTIAITRRIATISSTTRRKQTKEGKQ